MANELKVELSKAKDKFQSDQAQWKNRGNNLNTEVAQLKQKLEEKDKTIQDMQLDLDAKTAEIKTLNETLDQYDAHSIKQEEMIIGLSNVAEKKLIELKLALDKKTSETVNYHSQLQQTMTQVHVFRQENAALKEYISKIASLQQQVQI